MPAASMPPDSSAQLTGTGNASASIPKVSNCKTDVWHCACNFRNASSHWVRCAVYLKRWPMKRGQNDQLGSKEQIGCIKQYFQRVATCGVNLLMQCNAA